MRGKSNGLARYTLLLLIVTAFSASPSTASSTGTGSIKGFSISTMFDVFQSNGITNDATCVRYAKSMGYRCLDDQWADTGRYFADSICARETNHH